jgi:hypothetical protein
LEHVGEGLFFGDEGATTVGPVPALVLGSGVHVVHVVIVVVIAVAVHRSSPFGKKISTRLEFETKKKKENTKNKQIELKIETGKKRKRAHLFFWAFAASTINKSSEQ